MEHIFFHLVSFPHQDTKWFGNAWTHELFHYVLLLIDSAWIMQIYWISNLSLYKEDKEWPLLSWNLFQKFNFGKVLVLVKERLGCYWLCFYFDSTFVYLTYFCSFWSALPLHPSWIIHSYMYIYIYICVCVCIIYLCINQ